VSLRLLWEADLFVLPSLSEGLPLALLEAMAARKAVVASDVGGVRDVVLDGETGLLVPPGDPDRLSTAITTLLRDPARCAEMGKRGRARVEQHFSVQKMVAAYEQLYTRLLMDRGIVVG
jgi:glycosyltransferase involved in cell wall biosynthesis